MNTEYESNIQRRDRAIVNAFLQSHYSETEIGNMIGQAKKKFMNEVNASCDVQGVKYYSKEVYTRWLNS